jgi:hypothetical protein
MKIEYKDNMDETVDVHFRLAELTGNVTKARNYGLVWVPVVFVLLYFISPGTQINRVAISTLFSVTVFGSHIATYKNEMRKRIRKMLITAQGSADPVDCEYEINDDGFIFRKLGQDLKFSWKNVQSVTEKPDLVEIIMQPIGIAVLPKRAFSSNEEIQSWISFIEKKSGANQKLDPTVKTPVESGNEQGTAGQL